MKFMCSEEELQEMTGVVRDMTSALQRVAQKVDPTIPRVIYPRTPGYRPAPEDNPCNAWAWICDIQGAATGKLAGRTVAIKDNTAVAGVPMRCGTTLLDHYVPEFDATVVSRILDAGGRIVGKAGVEALCMTGSSITSADGPVTHPLDKTRVVGGSSSGCGVLVASGHVDMAVGGDQGGSIRIPASFTGIVGLKPTWGLVPYTGAAHVEPSVDHLGPMAKTVADCALMLEVIAGYDDGRDPRQCPNLTVPEYSKLIEQDISGKKIGLLEEGFQLCSEEAVKEVVREATEALTQAGCILSTMSVPSHKNGGDLFVAAVSYASNKCMLENTDFFAKGFHPTSMQEAMARGLKTSPQDVPPLSKCRIMCSRYVDRLYGTRFHGKARNLILDLERSYDAALKEVDVLVMPTLPHTAPLIPAADIRLSDLAKHCWGNNPNTLPFNLTGHPAISVNAGFSPGYPDCEGGLPIGVMIVGRKFDEVTVLQVARAFEKRAGKR
ncbi:amidase-like isoform X2 [Babylonia areolata]